MENIKDKIALPIIKKLYRDMPCGLVGAFSVYKTIAVPFFITLFIQKAEISPHTKEYIKNKISSF